MPIHLQIRVRLLVFPEKRAHGDAKSLANPGQDRLPRDAWEQNLQRERPDLNAAIREGAEAYAIGKAPDLIAGAAGLALSGASKVADLFDANQGVSEAEAEWRSINAALKVKPSQVRLAPGTASMENAYGIPGRSVAHKVGVSAGDLAKMNPFEQGAKIAPAWKDAGGR